MSQSILKTLGIKNRARRLSNEEMSIGTRVMQENLRLQKNEQVLIVCDTKTFPLEAGLLFEAAKTISEQTTLVLLTPATENAQEPPEPIARRMSQVDVAFLVTTYSLSHTKARKKATESGTRIASLPGITLDIMLRTLGADYSVIAKRSKKLAGLLTAASTVYLTSSNGTDIHFDLSGRSAYADTGYIHNPGDFDNLPAGEAFIAPREELTDGTLRFDGCFAGTVLDCPIEVVVEKGFARDIRGGEAARLLIERLSRVGPLGYAIAELGIGTNDTATLDSISVLEAEKVFETVHVALGNNATIGGTVDVPFHSDGVILSPTLTIDDTVVLKDGTFQL